MRILVLGDLNLDVLAVTPDDLGPGDEARAPVRVAPGGSAGTFARVAAGQGADVRFVGCIGNDPVGNLLARWLEEAGVETALRRIDAPSGTILSLCSDDDRTMICSRGANDGLTADWIRRELFVGVDHMHLSGYALLSDAQRPAARKAIRLAAERGVTISCDPPPANLIISMGADRFRRELSDIDWLFPNLSEGRVLTGSDEPGEIVARLAAEFEAGSLTLAAEGALAWRGSQRHRCETRRLAAVDPTGAGDAYAAAFVCRLLQGASLRDANERACGAARAHLGRKAAAPSGP